MELDGAEPSAPPVGIKPEPPKEQKTRDPVKYSPIFQLGLFLSVRLRFLFNVTPTGLTRLFYIAADESCS